MYCLVSPDTDLRFTPSLLLIFAERGLMLAFGGGGEDMSSVGKAASYSPLRLPSMLV